MGKIKSSTLVEYCTGCGLCESYASVQFHSKDGLTYPVLDSDEKKSFCQQVCLANGNHLNNQETSVWGKYISVYKGFSADEDIRFKAASGGVTTAICLYLIENKLVDGIIQVSQVEENPYATRTNCSKTREDILKCMASRYIISSPLSNLKVVLEQGGKYAVVGRPCDCIVINNLLERFPDYKKNIYCVLSFFCAGVPGINASKKLAQSLGVDPDNVKHIQYRGNGWPGKAMVTDLDDISHEMKYIDSWNNILGRDIRKICKFCTDGVGEFADVSSGDLWNLKDSKPIFDESGGMNVVFARTELGLEIIQKAKEQGYIDVEAYEDDINELSFVQPNHANRKKWLYPRILGMKIMMKPTPAFDMNKLKAFSAEESTVKIIKTVLGTIKRIVKKKL